MRMKAKNKYKKFNLFALFMSLFMFLFFRNALFLLLINMKILCCDNYEISISNFCVFLACFAQYLFFFQQFGRKGKLQNVWTWRQWPCTYCQISLKMDPNFSLHSFLSFCLSFSFSIVISIRNGLFYIIYTYCQMSLKVDLNFSLHSFLSSNYIFAFRFVIFIRNTCLMFFLGYFQSITLKIKYSWNTIFFIATHKLQMRKLN